MTPDDLKKKAQALIDKIEKIHQSEEYKSVWTLAWSHGMPYSGETYEKELEELKKQLENEND